MKLSHVNCRSLYKKSAQIGYLFKQSEILCCTETWLSHILSDSLKSIEDKTVFRRDRKTRGGGVCIYVNNTLSPFCTVDEKSSYISPDLEIITIDLKKTGLKYMKFSCIYRPPRGDIKKCIDKLSEMLSRRENFKKEIWLFGDFNVDYLKRGEENYKKFVNLFKTFGLSQLITNVTRPNTNTTSGTCIDWIVTNSRFVKDSYVLNIFISDHFPVECIRKKLRERHTTVYRNVCSYKNYDKNILVELLRLGLAETSYETEMDLNAKWDIFYSIIYDILAIMCPYKKYRQREIPTPWITPEIYRNIRYRDSLVNLFKLTRSNHYLTLMRRQRNIVNTMIDSSKKKYISKLLDNNSSCPKQFWKLINQFLKGDTRSHQYPRFVDPSTNDEIPLGGEALFLNEYFCNISRRLGFDPCDRVTYTDNDYLNMYSNIEDTFDLAADPVTVEELSLYIDEIDLTKNCCIAGISTEICRDLLLMVPN